MLYIDEILPAAKAHLLLQRLQIRLFAHNLSPSFHISSRTAFLSRTETLRCCAHHPQADAGTLRSQSKFVLIAKMFYYKTKSTSIL